MFQDLTIYDDEGGGFKFSDNMESSQNEIINDLDLLHVEQFADKKSPVKRNHDNLYIL